MKKLIIALSSKNHIFPIFSGITRVAGRPLALHAHHAAERLPGDPHESGARGRSAVGSDAPSAPALPQRWAGERGAPPGPAAGVAGGGGPFRAGPTSGKLFNSEGENKQRQIFFYNIIFVLYYNICIILYYTIHCLY